MQVAIFTREYPPDVYGGAGVHVEYLARELARRCSVDVHCFGAPRPDADGATVITARPDDALAEANAALQTLSVDLRLTASVTGADVAHSHTWYANLAGHLVKLLHDVPHVVTAHSLEPLRPWKAEQLGGGYAISSWAERTAIEAADAVIAVSAGMRADLLGAYPSVDPDRVHVIYNGIDTDEYRPDLRTDVVTRVGMDPDRPSVIFVGRITRQKGLRHLLDAAAHLDPSAQLVLCAGAPDTPEIAASIAAAVTELQATRSGVLWIQEMLPKADVIQLLSHATVFACPSIYEPMGIVNLEAMACETAVVATATGGIPEVVAGGETGLLVPLEQRAPGDGPVDADRFARDFAADLNALIAEPDRARAMGVAGRRRAIETFGWPAIAEQTQRLYESLVTP